MAIRLENKREKFTGREICRGISMGFFVVATIRSVHETIVAMKSKK
jgi:hypothetical protein